MAINPITLKGNWDEGWALDEHVISSEYMGEDPYGHQIFKTNRTEIGQLLYMLKYNHRYENVVKILHEAIPFLDKWDKMDRIDVILPVPPSKPRTFQPTVEIARVIADYYNISFKEDVLRKLDQNESKNMENISKDLDSVVVAEKRAKREFNVLLIDDLYSTGATLRACVKALKNDRNLKGIYVLTVTKTKVV